MPNLPSRFQRLLLIGLSVTALMAISGDTCRARTWTDSRQAGPFICRADFPLDGIESMFADLTQLQNDLVRYLGIRPASESIELYLFRDQWSYRSFLEEQFPTVPYRKALYMKSGDRGIVLAYQNREFEIDVRHECTHALLHAALPMVPLWLDEGLAEYFELPPAQRAFNSPHLGGIRWNSRLGGAPSLESLERTGDFTEMGGSEYRDSWAWAHFMLHGPVAAHDIMVEYLRAIQASSPPGILSHQLRRQLPDVEERFVQHFRNWQR